MKKRRNRIAGQGAWRSGRYKEPVTKQSSIPILAFGLHFKELCGLKRLLITILHHQSVLLPLFKFSDGFVFLETCGQ